MEREVTLLEMLEAREDRVRQQDALRERCGTPVVSFTLNIAGPVKDSSLIRRAFRWGQEQLEAGLTAAKLPVLDRDGRKLDREKPRNCIVCGAPGKGCASRRVHAVEELQGATRRILEEHFAAADRKRVSALATWALLDEVCITPKPGLVDRANSGSHRDMDIFTFTASAAALSPYWGRCFQIGRETAGLSPAETFVALKRVGQEAERIMFAATGGVNTHKGAIFTLGTICGAVGRLWRAEAPCREPEVILAECAGMVSAAMEEDFATLSPDSARTAGEQAYLEEGLTGVRGEAAKGFPGGLHALCVLDHARNAGRSLNDAGAIALLHLIARGTDTNMATRGGPERAKKAAEDCARLLKCSPLPELEEIARLDQEFMRDNFSPDGCADLLAAALFLQYYQNLQKMIVIKS